MTLRVVGAGEAVRAVPVLQFTLIDVRYGQRNQIQLEVGGITPDRATPTGSVSLFEDDRLVGKGFVHGKSVTITFEDTSLGSHRYTAVYSGDARFFETSAVSASITPRPAVPIVRVAPVDGTSKVVVTVRGVRGFPPTGSLVVVENGVSRAPDGPLAPASDSSSSTTVSGIAPGARTLRVVYSGDARHLGFDATVPIEPPAIRRRSVHP